MLSDSLLESDDEFRSNATQSVMRIQSASSRMRNLIDDLLMYATARDTKLLLTSFDLAEVVNDITVARSETPPGADHDPPKFTIGELGMVYADQALVRQSLDNLIGNAIKYTAPGVQPQVNISAVQLDKSWLRVEVRDRGIGIPVGHHDRVFDDFHRAHRDSSYSGNGLGLSICKRVIERHGGTIGVEDNPGGGSCFYFTLPISTQARMQDTSNEKPSLAAEQE